MFIYVLLGNYENLSQEGLPQFWLAYFGDPSDSGKIHNDVAVRWRNGMFELLVRLHAMWLTIFLVITTL